MISFLTLTILILVIISNFVYDIKRFITFYNILKKILDKILYIYLFILKSKAIIKLKL